MSIAVKTLIGVVCVWGNSSSAKKGESSLHRLNLLYSPDEDDFDYASDSANSTDFSVDQFLGDSGDYESDDDSSLMQLKKKQSSHHALRGNHDDDFSDERLGGMVGEDDDDDDKVEEEHLLKKGGPKGKPKPKNLKTADGQVADENDTFGDDRLDGSSSFGEASFLATKKQGKRQSHFLTKSNLSLKDDDDDDYSDGRLDGYTGMENFVANNENKGSFVQVSDDNDDDYSDSRLDDYGGASFAAANYSTENDDDQ